MGWGLSSLSNGSETMMQMIEANWPLLAGVLALAVVLAFFLLRSGGKKPPQREIRDVLSEGAAPAQRNNALIAAPSAATVATMPPPSLAPEAPVAEPIPVAPAPVEPAPAPAPAAPVAAAAEPAPAPVAPEGADDLTRIKGLGPKLKTLLAGLGITRFAQIAAWTEADLAAIDPKLGAFAGRPARDNWIEQARLLSSGDTGAYEDKFGKL